MEEIATKEITEIISQFNESFRLHDISIINNLIAEDCIMEAAMPAPNGSRTVGKKDCLIFWQQLIEKTKHNLAPKK